MTREEKFPWSMQETIENLKDLKVILQEQLKKKNYEGQGDRDVKEIALDFDRAIESLEKQIPKFVESKGYKGIRDTRYKCPVCKKFVRVNTKHCDECGQALKFPKLKRIDNRFEFDWTEEGE